MHPFATAFPDFGLTPEQRREAVLGHYYEYPGMDGERDEIWCYTPRLAYLPGETVTLLSARPPRPSASKSSVTAAPKPRFSRSAPDGGLAGFA